MRKRRQALLLEKLFKSLIYQVRLCLTGGLVVSNASTFLALIVAADDDAFRACVSSISHDGRCRTFSGGDASGAVCRTVSDHRTGCSQAAIVSSTFVTLTAMSEMEAGLDVGPIEAGPRL